MIIQRVRIDQHPVKCERKEHQAPQGGLGVQGAAVREKEEINSKLEKKDGTKTSGL